MPWRRSGRGRGSKRGKALLRDALPSASYPAGGARGGSGVRYLLGGAAVAVREDSLPNVSGRRRGGTQACHHRARRKYAEVANPSWKPPSIAPAGPLSRRAGSSTPALLLALIHLPVRCILGSCFP